MIRLENVSVVFKHKDREVTAVKDVSLHIQKGDIYGIVGTSGAGKSSLIRTLNGLQKPTKGRIFIDGEDITNLKGKGLRDIRKKIGMIFQHFNLISRKTVGQNIEFALKVQKYPKKDRKKRVEELLEIVGILDKKDVYPANLSGGQKQRVGIARALAANPKILLCDEATSALDVQTTEEIVALLKKVNEEMGITIVFITHQLEIAKLLFHKVAVMSKGVLVEEDETYHIFASPKHEVTQKLVKANIQIPDAIIKAAKGEVLTLVYKGEKSVEPIIAYTHKQFDVILNILYGKIEYIDDKPIGLLVVELEGSQEACDGAKKYLSENVEELIPFTRRKEEVEWKTA